MAPPVGGNEDDEQVLGYDPSDTDPSADGGDSEVGNEASTGPDGDAQAPATGMIAGFSSKVVSVDGTLSSGEWDVPSYPMDAVDNSAPGIVTQGSTTAAADASAVVYIKHDADHLYVAVDVSDDQVVATAAEVWDADSVELFLDHDNSKTTNVGMNRVQFDVAAGGATAATSSVPAGSWSGGAALRPGGYVVEYRISKAAFGLATGGTYGIDIAVTDVEPGAGNVETGYWYYSTTEASTNESLWGSVTLQASDNQPPLVDAGSDVVVPWPRMVGVVDGSVTDDGKPTPPGAVTLSWTKVSGPGTVKFGSDRGPRSLISVDEAGEYVLQLSASDGEVTATDTVRVTVESQTNQAPVVDAGTNKSVVWPNNRVILQGTATDDGMPNPPGSLITTWIEKSGPGSVVFGDIRSLNTTATFSIPGIYVLTLHANDGKVASSDTLTVTVSGGQNQAPLVDAGPDRAVTWPSNSVTLQGTVSDDGLPSSPGACAMTWSKVSGPGSVSFGNDEAPQTTATFSTQGVYSLELLADDGDRIAADTVTVRVLESNTLFAAYATGQVLIDGTIGGSEWAAAQANPIDAADTIAPGVVVQGTQATAADASATVYLLTDADYLYVAVDVSDDNVIAAGGSVWDLDEVELFLDHDNSRTTNTGTNRVQFAVAANGQTASASAVPAGSWVGAAESRTGGYMVEIRISKAAFGLEDGDSYGFDVAISDIEPSAGSVSTRYWCFSTTEAATNESKWGQVALDEQVQESDPSLAVNKGALSFGTASNNLTFEVWNDGSDVLNYSVSSSAAWVGVSPAGGDSRGEHDTITVTVDRSQLPAGTHQATATVNAQPYGTATVTVTAEVSAGVLSVTPAGGLTSSGPQGGSFNPLSQVYTLTNTGGSSITWTAAKTKNWVTLSKGGGTLALGATDTVTVSINSNANNLAAGSQSDMVSFTNTTNGAGNTTRSVALTVNATNPGALSVTPSGSLGSSGTQGGPFNPSSQAYTLSNTGASSINWTASKGQSWVSLSKASGTLAVGATDTVTASIGSGANSLSAGSYGDTVSFTNTTNGTGNTTRSVSLSISAAGSYSPMQTASRTSGVAPLAVFFDAVETASGVVQPSGNDYPSLHYVWDFGDDPSATYSTTGRGKNRATGYVAAHVYENPGTYRVTLAVTNAAGQVSRYEQSVAVTAFSGTTYYVSNSQGSDSNTGLSEGAAFKSWGKAMSMTGSNRRILFKRGDSWTSSGGATIGSAGPGIVGAYGSGASPLINITGTGAALDLRGTDWRIMDLSLNGPGSSSQVSGIEGSSLTRNLILRTTVQRFRVGIAYGWGGASTHAENTIADCVASNNVINNGYVGGQKIAVLGSRFETPDISHLLRVWGIRKGVISNNYMNAPGGDRLALKLHNEIGLSLPDAQYIVVSENDLRGHVYVVSIAPQAWDYDERVKDVVFEKNTVRSMSDTFTALIVEAQRVTIRNNTFIADGGGDWYTGMSVNGNEDPGPADHKIYNNTIYRGQGGKEFTAISASGADVRNNLACAPGTPGAVFGTSTSNNLISNSPGFVNPASGDFRLQTGSAARNTGMTTPYVRECCSGASRPQGGAYDIGSTEQ